MKTKVYHLVSYKTAQKILGRKTATIQRWKRNNILINNVHYVKREGRYRYIAEMLDHLVSYGHDHPVHQQVCHDFSKDYNSNKVRLVMGDKYQEVG